MKASKKIDAAVERVAEQHGDCDNATCDIAAALRYGYALWAVELYSGAVEDDKFASLYASLPKVFAEMAEEERVAMCDTLCHRECTGCNAVTWCEPEEASHFDTCDNCLAVLPTDVL